MSRINTNVASLIAQRVLTNQSNALNTSLERLSTGLRINRGKDDPAGLIASEKLRSEKVALESALNSAQRADQVVSIADSGLQEISSLLTQVQGLVTATANDGGLSSDEKDANQLQIDSILQTIDRISSTASFQGTKLLNGTLDFQITGQSSSVTDFTVNNVKLATSDTLAVNTIVTTSAQHGALYLSAGGTQLDLTNASSTFVFELTGSQGSRQFSFASGTTLASIATNVNNFKQVTGVSATASGNIIKLRSTDYGSDHFVSFKLVTQGGQAGSLALASSVNEAGLDTATATAFSTIAGQSATRDEGQDLGAIINGVAARGKGLTATVNSDALGASITLTSGAAKTLGSISAFTISGGGASFNLGPSVNIGNQVRLGIGDIASSKLGNSTLGFLDSLGSGKTNNIISGDLNDAQKIVNAAIDKVSTLRARLGSFQSFGIQSTITSLSVALENTSAAESAIRDTDFANETANLTRSQILVQAATQAVSIAKAGPQRVLQLLQ